ncbi:MAG TPA: AMP-binding protein [Streptosporangiaceae bacterium]|nr:AMP-binding protein [Streptosporangiaceae bacterium]
MWDTVGTPDPAKAAAYREAGWWRDETFLADLDHAVASRPDHPAIIAYEHGRLARILSYAELATMVARFAGALTELGVGWGDIVVPYLPNRWMLAPLYLACSRIGAVSAPAQPELKGREMGHLLRESRAGVCITVDEFEGTAYGALVAQVAPPTLRHQVVVGDASRTGGIDFEQFFVRTPWEERGRLSATPLGADDPSLLVFTSGTTGQAKAVVHSQNTIYAAGRSMAVPFGLTAQDIVSIPQLLTHVAGLMHAVYAPITLGATCVMHDTNNDVDVLLDMVEAHRVTYVHAAPRNMTHMIAAQRARPRDASSLRLLSSSSAPIPPDMVTNAAEVFGLPLFSCWGMTETGGCTTTRPDDPPDWAAHSDGRAMPWMEIRVDAEPGSQIGRLLVRGASLCLGYLNQPEAFAACLDADGWFDTGDMARHDGRGGIRMTGRRVDLITRATGEKVPTSEIEAVLQRHPAVGEVVLIGYPDPHMPGSEDVCAVVVPDRSEPPPRLADLREHLEKEQVTDEAWPDRIEIVTALPKNGLGKVLRTVLRADIEGRPAQPA